MPSIVALDNSQFPLWIKQWVCMPEVAIHEVRNPFLGIHKVDDVPLQWILATDLRSIVVSNSQASFESGWETHSLSGFSQNCDKLSLGPRPNLAIIGYGAFTGDA